MPLLNLPGRWATCFVGSSPDEVILTRDPTIASRRFIEGILGIIPHRLIRTYSEINADRCSNAVWLLRCGAKVDVVHRSSKSKREPARYFNQLGRAVGEANAIAGCAEPEPVRRLPGSLIAYWSSGAFPSIHGPASFMCSGSSRTLPWSPAVQPGM